MKLSTCHPRAPRKEKTSIGPDIPAQAIQAPASTRPVTAHVTSAFQRRSTMNSGARAMGHSLANTASASRPAPVRSLPRWTRTTPSTASSTDSMSMRSQMNGKNKKGRPSRRYTSAVRRPQAQPSSAAQARSMASWEIPSRTSCSRWLGL